MRLFALLLLAGVLTACARTLQPTPTQPSASPVPSALKQWSAPPPMQIDINKRYQAVLVTTEGDIVIDLFPKEAPKTVNNFVFLARQGFYDGVKFHRIIKGFMVQTGDPTGTGMGGPGYTFEDEPVRRDYTPGIVAMANAGPNTNGSQFFIMHGSAPLPKAYTIFGQVAQGMEVVDRIANTPVTAGPGGELSRPTRDVRILRVEIRESP
ncbi:putative peptidyl-prolyl cis-trans isomerase [bacterium HR23]|nr:putative peptidyl-prolyl cis-trans isomerase [bacterium HR23]